MLNICHSLLNNVSYKPLLRQGNTVPFMTFGTQYEGRGDPNWYNSRDEIKLDSNGLFIRMFGKPTSKVTDWCYRHNWRFYPDENNDYIYYIKEYNTGYGEDLSWVRGGKRNNSLLVGGPYAYTYNMIKFGSGDSRLPEIECKCTKQDWSVYFYIPMKALPDEFANKNIELCYTTACQWVGNLVDKNGVMKPIPVSNYKLNDNIVSLHPLHHDEIHYYMGWDHEGAGGQGWGTFSLYWLYKVYYTLYNIKTVNNVTFSPIKEKVC